MNPLVQRNIYMLVSIRVLSGNIPKKYKNERMEERQIYFTYSIYNKCFIMNT